MLRKLLKAMVSYAPGFPQYVMSFGIYVDDDCNIVGLDSRRAYLRRGGHGGGGGGRGGGGMSGWLIGIITVLFLAYIALSLISEFAPTIGNMTYEGDGLGATIFGLVQTWMLPLALVGLLIYVVAKFLGGRR